VQSHARADFCPIVDDDITGATGPIVSCYLRDPDQNPVELSNYAP